MLPTKLEVTYGSMSLKTQCVNISICGTRWRRSEIQKPEFKMASYSIEMSKIQVLLFFIHTCSLLSRVNYLKNFFHFPHSFLFIHHSPYSFAPLRSQTSLRVLLFWTSQAVSGISWCDVMSSQERLSAFCSLFKAHVVAQRLISVLNQPGFEGLCSTQLSLAKGNALEHLHFVC